MFKSNNTTEILESCKKRGKPLTDTDLSKLSINDTEYCSFISSFDRSEITPDIIIYSLEEAVKANEYIATEYPEIAQEVWQIGCTGIGDQWFLDKESFSILFFDHDQGEYTDAEFIDLNIKFNDFLLMASLVRSLENFLDENTNFDEEKIETEFMTELNKISPNLYENYPYNWI